MKQTLIRTVTHPQIKAVAATVLTEVTTKGLYNSYDSFMDTLAYKIAVYIHELEKEDAERRKNNGI